MNGGLGVPVARGILRRDGDNVLQALDVNLVRGVAFEEIEKQALCQSVLVADGALKRGACKEEHGSQANGKLFILELRHGPEGLRVEVQLQHVEDLVAECADKRQRVRPLLLAAPKDEEGGVVLLGEEFERGGVFKGVDGVLLGEFLGEREAERMEVGEGVLRDLRAGRAA